MNVAIFEIELGGFEGGLRRFHLCLVHIDGVLLRVVIQLRYGAGVRDEALYISSLSICQIEGRLALRELRLGGIERCLEGARVDGEEQLPFFRSAPSSKCRSVIRPETWGVTVTDSNAPPLPISSR